MMTRRTLILALSSLLGAVAPQLAAAPVPCAGGTIDFTATSYDPAVPLTTFNVGQQVTLTAVASGIAPASFLWTIQPPHLKDYDERIGTTATGAISWSTTPLSPADLASPTVTFFWKPSAAQVHPGSGAETRTVTLTATVGTTTCTNTQSFTVERNATDIDRQAEDFYTRNYRAPTETDLNKGRVLDDHHEWHMVFGTRLLDFLEWHHEFIDRANRWRAEFGYPPILPWYPGNPIPAGPEIDDSTRGGFFDPDWNRIPIPYTLAGGAGGPIRRLADFATLASFSLDLEAGWHGDVHCSVGGTMCTYDSPRDPLFFRWHGLLDRLYANYCSLKGLACAGVTQPPSDVWLADNASDIAAGGAEPSSGAMWMSPSVWNRTMAAACTPADPVAGVARTCGSDADHENPIAGVTNYLYARVRNDRPGAQQIHYLEVGVYVADASTGLNWPASFGGDPDGALPETRQFLTVSIPPGQVTDIGPLPWTPPSPAPSDHWCLYVRALSEQAPITTPEAAAIATNTAANNNIVWRNVQIVINSTDSATFTIQNPGQRARRAGLRIEVPPAFIAGGSVRLMIPREVYARWRRAGKLEGFERAVEIRPDPRQQLRLAENLPKIEPLLGPTSRRERELRHRIAVLEREVRACAQGGGNPRPMPSAQTGDAAHGRIDPSRERRLVDAIVHLERQKRACLRQRPGLVALKMTRQRATLSGLTLRPGERTPLTLEFQNDRRERADHSVLVVQEIDGKVVGGNTYIVRTGTH